MAASRHPANLPLAYACSGCSSAAQAANHIALALDRAQTDCIAEERMQQARSLTAATPT